MSYLSDWKDWEQRAAEARRAQQQENRDLTAQQRCGRRPTLDDQERGRIIPGARQPCVMSHGHAGLCTWERIPRTDRVRAIVVEFCWQHGREWIERGGRFYGASCDDVEKCRAESVKATAYLLTADAHDRNEDAGCQTCKNRGGGMGRNGPLAQCPDCGRYGDHDHRIENGKVIDEQGRIIGEQG